MSRAARQVEHPAGFRQFPQDGGNRPAPELAPVHISVARRFDSTAEVGDVYGACAITAFFWVAARDIPPEIPRGRAFLVVSSQTTAAREVAAWRDAPAAPSRSWVRSTDRLG